MNPFQLEWATEEMDMECGHSVPRLIPPKNSTEEDLDRVLELRGASSRIAMEVADQVLCDMPTSIAEDISLMQKASIKKVLFDLPLHFRLFSVFN